MIGMGIYKQLTQQVPAHAGALCQLIQIVIWVRTAGQIIQPVLHYCVPLTTAGGCGYVDSAASVSSCWFALLLKPAHFH
jgi:hypothetical protein